VTAKERSLFDQNATLRGPDNAHCFHLYCTVSVQSARSTVTAKTSGHPDLAGIGLERMTGDMFEEREKCHRLAYVFIISKRWSLEARYAELSIYDIYRVQCACNIAVCVAKVIAKTLDYAAAAATGIILASCTSSTAAFGNSAAWSSWASVQSGSTGSAFCTPTPTKPP